MNNLYRFLVTHKTQKNRAKLHSKRGQILTPTHTLIMKVVVVEEWYSHSDLHGLKHVIILFHLWCLTNARLHNTAFCLANYYADYCWLYMNNYADVLTFHFHYRETPGHKPLLHYRETTAHKPLLHYRETTGHEPLQKNHWT